MGEADRLLSVLTGERGVIRVFANGVKRTRSRNISSTSLLCYSDFTLYSSRDTYKLNQAETIDSFYNLRNSIHSLALAQYLCEIAGFFCVQDAPDKESGEVLRMLLNALYLICGGKKDPRLIKAAVELRLLTLEGYMPDLTGCVGCRIPPLTRGAGVVGENLFFSLENGHMRCEACAKDAARLIALPAGVLAAMRHIVSCEPGRLFSFELGNDAKDHLSRVCELYLLHTANCGFKTLEFLRTVAE